jgi:hypothetical protein
VGIIIIFSEIVKPERDELEEGLVTTNVGTERRKRNDGTKEQRNNVTMERWK